MGAVLKAWWYNPDKGLFLTPIQTFTQDAVLYKEGWVYIGRYNKDNTLNIQGEDLKSTVFERKDYLNYFNIIKSNM